MNNFFKSFKKYTLISAICLTVLGLLFICIPSVFVKIIGYCISISGLIISAIFIISGLRSKEYHWSEKFMISVWAVVFLASLYFTVKPDAITGIVYKILGVVILLSGISKLQTALDLKRLKQNKWWSYLIISICVIAIAIVSIMKPFAAATATLVLIGSGLVISGVSDLISIFVLSKKVKENTIVIPDSEDKNR